MPNLDETQIRAQQNEPLRSSSSIGNVVATTGETSQDRFTYETRDVRQSEPTQDGKSQEETVDHVITLKRDERGFGFRIVGGQEEGTQVWE